MGLNQSAPPKLKPFMVLAELYTGSEEKASMQLDLLKPVVEYERQQKQCGCYFFLSPVNGDRTVITLFESYDTREYMFESHHKSSPFQRMKDLEYEHGIRSAKTQSLFLSPSGGFLEREIPSGIPVSEQFYRITKMKCDAETRPEAITVLTTHARFLRDHANEVLSYLVVVDTKDPSAVVLFERYPSETVAKVIGLHEKSQSAVETLRRLNVAQESQEYRPVRGFLSGREGSL